MNMFFDGLTLMAIGLTFVLTFLSILICAMIVMSKVITYLNKVFPEVVPASQSKTTINKSSNNDDEAIAVALAVIKSRG